MLGMSFFFNVSLIDSCSKQTDLRLIKFLSIHGIQEYFVCNLLAIMNVTCSNCSIYSF